MALSSILVYCYPSFRKIFDVSEDALALHDLAGCYFSSASFIAVSEQHCPRSLTPGRISSVYPCLKVEV